MLKDRVLAEKSTNFIGFIDDLRKLWDAAGKPGDIKRKAPKSDEEKFPIITYRVLKRIPHPSFKEIMPRYRDMANHLERNGEYVEVYGQVQQAFVEFKIYSQSDEEADELMSDLEEFLYFYRGYFKRRGVKDILFSSQESDETDTKFHVPIATRTLIYDIHFEKVVPRYINQIRQVAVQANIHEELD